MTEDAITLLLEHMPERKARALLAGLEVPARVRQAFELIASTRHARELLGKGLCVRSTAYQLCARYGFAMRTAYRRIDDALDAGPR